MQEQHLRALVFVSIISAIFFTGRAHAQKQLVLLKRENVLLRLNPGDEIVFKTKGSKRVRTSYINNLSDTALVAHRDTVPFHTIDRIYFKRRRFYNTIGAALVVFGTGLFLIDQVNVVLVNGQSPSLDNRVSALSLGSLAVGLPLALTRPGSQRIRFPVRIRTVEEGSVFYRPDLRESIYNP